MVLLVYIGEVLEIEVFFYINEAFKKKKCIYPLVNNMV